MPSDPPTPSPGPAPRRSRLSLFSRGPSARDLLRELDEVAAMRLKQIGGRPAVALLDASGGVHQYEVPSKEFFRAVDDLRADRQEPRPSEKSLVRLSRLIENEVRDPGFVSGPPIVVQGRSWENRPSPVAEVVPDRPGRSAPGAPGTDGVFPFDLDALRVRDRPLYLPQKVGDLTDVEVLRRAFQHRKNVLIEGPPGCGKSLLVRAFAYEMGLPFARWDLHDSFETDDVLGKWVRRGGAWGWSEGALPALMARGGVAFLDELNAARRNTVSRLHSILDSRTLFLPEHLGEAVTASPGFFLVAAQNPQTEFANPLLDRLRDRFQVHLRMGYSDALEERFCPDRVGLEIVRALRGADGIETPVSTRMLVAYVENRRVYGPRVALSLLVSAFSADEKEAVIGVLRDVQGRRKAPRREVDS